MRLGARSTLRACVVLVGVSAACSAGQANTVWPFGDDSGPATDEAGTTSSGDTASSSSGASTSGGSGGSSSISSGSGAGSSSSGGSSSGAAVCGACTSDSQCQSACGSARLYCCDMTTLINNMGTCFAVTTATCPPPPGSSSSGGSSSSSSGGGQRDAGRLDANVVRDATFNRGGG